MNKELEEVIEKLKMINNAKSGCDYEIALFEFGEYSEIALNYIENSIPKEKVEEKIEELKDMKVEGEVFKTSVNFAIKILQELLEGK